MIDRHTTVLFPLLASFTTILLSALMVGAWVFTPVASFAQEHAIEHSPAVSGKKPPAVLPMLDDDVNTQQRFMCPMHTHIVQDHPGQCPICGMDLVPVKSKSAGIVVDAATRQMLGVKITKVKQKSLSRDLHSYGTVAIDKSSIIRMNAKYSGWIRKLHVFEVGHRVKAGDTLYEFYSPDLIQRQRDYLKLVERRIQLRKLLPSPDAKENETVMMLMQEALNGRQRLFYEDFDSETISDIESRKAPLDVFPIKAPKDGVVVELDASEGAFVKDTQNIVTIADLSRVWIDINIYEDQSRWVRNGDTVTITTRDKNELNGTLRIVSPVLNAQTRTLLARMEVSNSHGQLRPGDFVDATIHAQPRQRLAVPRSAILRSGKGDYVMRHDGDGRFVPTAVTIGVENTFWTELLSGLRANDEVASNGQFLLAAEANMQDVLSRATPTVPNAHQHE